VQFDANSARLTNIAKAKLDEVALKMKEDTDITALVIGYTDSQGSATANQRMSERRAQAVKDYLVSRHGIDPSRITTEGRGSADPVASNDTAAGRAQNRRAVVILTIPP
jgi:outer membrane protein OmpA-like peptidoglycan-associated protein